MGSHLGNHSPQAFGSDDLTLVNHARSPRPRLFTTHGEADDPVLLAASPFEGTKKEQQMAKQFDLDGLLVDLSGSGRGDKRSSIAWASRSCRRPKGDTAGTVESLGAGQGVAPAGDLVTWSARWHGGLSGRSHAQRVAADACGTAICPRACLRT
jgi:hypothetical protein